MAEQPPAPMLNFLVKPTAKPLSKTMKYFFVMLHFVFALDFGFIKFTTQKHNAFVKIITITHSTILLISISLNFFGTSHTMYTYSAFFLDVIIYYAFTFTLVAVKHTFHDFQIDLNSFDAEINVDSSSYRVEYKIILWFFLLVIYRLFTIVIYCSFYLAECEFPIHTLIYNVVLIGTDVVLVVYTYVFHSVYLRLTTFTQFVVKDGTDMVSCQFLYKSIVDMTETAKQSFDVVLVLTLVSNTVDAILHVYLPFATETVKSSNAYDMSVAYVVTAQQVLMLFCPAISAGLLSGQVDKLTLVLHDKLITEDSTRVKDIRRFLRYTEGRPLRFRVWRVVPLDWRLPVVVVNVIITYLIVMIQFTHKNEE